MRNKIILANALIVLVCGLLTFSVVRMSIVGAAQNPARVAELGVRDAKGAAARFQLDALRVERWVSGKALEVSTRDFVSRATKEAKGDTATASCDSILSLAKQSFTNPPSIVLITDANGKIVGRNGSAQQRGDDLAATYPALKEAMAKATSGSDVWVKGGGVDQYVVSYAPIRDEKGGSAGTLVVGRPLNEALAQLSDASQGGGIVILAVDGPEVRAAAYSTGTADVVKALIEKSKGELKAALNSSKVTLSDPGLGEATLGLIALDSLGSGRNGVLAAVAPSTLIDGASSMAMPILFVMVLALLLVGVAGWFLGSYVQHPIEMLEEGLLAILNGQSDKRFELDHAELGGLAFRIDQLLNQLMGIDEDTSDASGRISRPPPPAATYGEAAGETRPQNESAPQYYARLYREYIAAKRSLGEAVDHITEEAFTHKIQGMEQEALQKHGKTVRYQVQATAKEVQLLAVPLA